MTDPRLVAAATGLMGVLKGENYTSSECLAIFELALRIGRMAAPSDEPERVTRMVDRILAEAGLRV